MPIPPYLNVCVCVEGCECGYTVCGWGCECGCTYESMSSLSLSSFCSSAILCLYLCLSLGATPPPLSTQTHTHTHTHLCKGKYIIFRKKKLNQFEVILMQYGGGVTFFFFTAGGGTHVAGGQRRWSFRRWLRGTRTPSAPHSLSLLTYTSARASLRYMCYVYIGSGACSFSLLSRSALVSLFLSRLWLWALSPLWLLPLSPASASSSSSSASLSHPTTLSHSLLLSLAASL